MTESHLGGTTPISWGRVRRIFGDPQPPRTVWERQFDYFDDEFRHLARTPYDQINFTELWYYHHDLAYVELQSDLFDYLFPVCLMDWHRSLLSNEPCSHGDSDFHYGLHRGNVLEKMVTPERRNTIYTFFRDSFSERLVSERGFIYSGSKTPAFGGSIGSIRSASLSRGSTCCGILGGRSTSRAMPWRPSSIART